MPHHVHVHVNTHSIDHILLLDSPEDHPGTQKVKVTTPQSPPPSAPAPPPPMSVASGMCVCTWVHVCVCVREQKRTTHYNLLLLRQPHRHIYCNCCRRYLSCRTCQWVISYNTYVMSRIWMIYVTHESSCSRTARIYFVAVRNSWNIPQPSILDVHLDKIFSLMYMYIQICVYICVNIYTTHIPIHIHMHLDI